MKLQKFAIFSLLLCLFFLSGCTKDDEPLKEIEVTLGPYMFVFPAGFKHIPERGIDSRPGNVTNGKLVFHYDYGYYNSQPFDFPGQEEVTEEVIEGHYFRMAQPLDSGNGQTSVFLYRISDKDNEYEDLYDTLKITITDLSPEDQELAISIFRTLTIVIPAFN